MIFCCLFIVCCKAKKPKLNSSHEESAEQQTLSRQQVPPPCPSTASPQSARLPTAAQAFVIPTGVQQPSNKAAAAAPVAMGVMPVAGSSSVTPLPCMPAPAALQSAMLDMWRFGARMGASPYAPGFLSMALAAPWAAGLRPASVPADTVPASPAGAGGSGSMQAASQMLPSSRRRACKRLGWMAQQQLGMDYACGRSHPQQQQQQLGWALPNPHKQWQQQGTCAVEQR